MATQNSTYEGVPSFKVLVQTLVLESVKKERPSPEKQKKRRKEILNQEAYTWGA